jgi:hypothetical protein
MSVLLATIWLHLEKTDARVNDRVSVSSSFHVDVWTIKNYIFYARSISSPSLFSVQ